MFPSSFIHLPNVLYILSIIIINVSAMCYRKKGKGSRKNRSTHIPRLYGAEIHHNMAVLLVSVGVVEGEESVGGVSGGQNLSCVTPHHMELGLEVTHRR